MKDAKISIKKTFDLWTRKYYLNFKKYSIIGLLAAFYEVALFWIFIDTLKANTVISTILIIGSSTIFKFYSYVYSGMMEKNFFQYISILAFFSILTVIMILVLVEILGFRAAYSSLFTAILLFVMRFFAYDKFNLLKHEK